MQAGPTGGGQGDSEARPAPGGAEIGTHSRRDDRKTWIAAATIVVSIFIPLMVAAVGYWSTAANQAAQSKRDSELAAAQSRRDFELEAARIVLSAGSPSAAAHKANALKALFPDKLSPTFATAFEPAAFETYSTARSKREVLNLLLAHPGQEAQILAWWAQLFPADASGSFSFLPAFAQGGLTADERATLARAIEEQIGR